ncbi:hypothetical protein E5Q_03185 [Mixia osmundae IAM 14324]|uniref:Radical SAM core domain-containing protein n=1 Tax=Mixia osmundae (strain CBS 9802 / IAM 14324 / JCM 22182 / KY 12970) TaxID=764103 RepID=G7E107_MIXOS|nr:hypothetical protein E5Q_03185 [Mixia osmundae IAM 14324]
MLKAPICPSKCSHTLATRLHDRPQRRQHASAAVPLSSSTVASGLPVMPTSSRLAQMRRKLAASPREPLVDRFGRRHDYLRISLTEKCNLRCTYCMPEQGAPLSPAEHLLSTPEIARIARLFVANGVRKIRLTGGEPTLRPDLLDLMAQLDSMHGVESIGITSNGIKLLRQLPALISNGLTHLNISLDTLDPFKFTLMTRRQGHSRVLQAIEGAVALLHKPDRHGRTLQTVKVNVVVIRGLNDDEVLDFAALAARLPVQIRFIEYMPFDDNHWEQKKLVPSAELLDRLRQVYPSLTRRPAQMSDTSRDYAPSVYDTVAAWRGTVGFISSMTDHFCSGCSRLRLNADGGVKVCLFGPPKLNLREKIREGHSDARLLSEIGAAVQQKYFAHDGKSSPSDIAKSRNAPVLLTTRVPIHLPQPSLGPSTRRLFSTSTSLAKLTHLDGKTSKARMVSVTDKRTTSRTASARGTVLINQAARELLQAQDANPKGNVFAVAQLAGIMAAKQTPHLIPLCHSIALSHVDVALELIDDHINITATAACQGPTGVEMEALTAVNVAALTVWDMLKSVAGKDMIIRDVRVMSKSGGKSGDWSRPSLT